MTKELNFALDFHAGLIREEAQMEFSRTISPKQMHEPEVHLRYLISESSVVAQGLKHLSSCSIRRKRLAEFMLNATFVESADSEAYDMPKNSINPSSN